MVLVLYDKTTTFFSNLGIGVLRDFKSEPLITEGLNGSFYLEFDYVRDGWLSEYLIEGNIIKVNNQPFRIWNVKKNTDDTKITILAKHLWFDLEKCNFLEDVAPTEKTGDVALAWILDRTNLPHQFTVTGDCTKIASARYVRMNPIDAVYNASNCILKRFGGELEIDGYNIILHNKRGNDLGLEIRQKKNLKGAEYSVDLSTLATRIMPIGRDGILLPEKYIDSPLIDNYFAPFFYKYEVDIGVDEENDITLESCYTEMRNKVQELFDAGIDKPSVSISIDFIELSKTTEYQQYSNLEAAHLGDSCRVFIPSLNLNLTTRIVKTVYNCSKKRITKIELGTPKPNYVSNNVDTEKILQNAVSSDSPTSLLRQAKDNATAMLKHPFSGYMYISEETGEFYLMDTNSIKTAQKIWKFGLGGIGYSSTGINGTYETAITSDGQIVADFITTGKLSTTVIEGYDQIIITVEKQNNKIAEVTQTVDELNSKISDIADITISGEDTDAQVELDNINQSEPIRLVIRPIGENISYVYPNVKLFPSQDLFLKVRTVRFANTKTGEIFDYELPDDLLYYDEENYDEFILDYDGQSCVVNKKVGYNADGTTYVLDNPTTIEYEYPKIELTDGDYTVSLLGYKSAYIFVRLMAQNIYTTQFATRAEVNSKVSQTANKINSEIDQKLSNYSTTTEMNNKITQEISKSENKISLEVSKKVDDEEYTKAQIIAKINDDTSEAQINADVIKLTADDILDLIAGNEINLTSKNITISSDDFSVDASGNVIANNATINGGVISLKDNSTSPSFSNSKIKISNDSLSEYTYWNRNQFVFNSDRGLVELNPEFLSISSKQNSSFTTIGQDSIYVADENGSRAFSASSYGTEVGTLYYENLVQVSEEKYKKDIKEFDVDCTKIILNSDVYSYKYNQETDEDKEHIGFVIGEDYKTDSRIIANGNHGINIANACAILWKGFQEQQEQIELLKQEIELLKNKEVDKK